MPATRACACGTSRRQWRRGEGRHCRGQTQKRGWDCPDGARRSGSRRWQARQARRGRPCAEAWRQTGGAWDRPRHPQRATRRHQGRRRRGIARRLVVGRTPRRRRHRRRLTSPVPAPRPWRTGWLRSTRAQSVRGLRVGRAARATSCTSAARALVVAAPRRAAAAPAAVGARAAAAGFPEAPRRGPSWTHTAAYPSATLHFGCRQHRLGGGQLLWRRAAFACRRLARAHACTPSGGCPINAREHQRAVLPAQAENRRRSW